jgi:hypothetical protein
MVSPQERHTIVRVLSGTRCGCSIAGIDGVQNGMFGSTETGGSAYISQPPTPGTGPLSVVERT